MDRLIALFYQAGASLISWDEAIQALRESLPAAFAALVAVNRASQCVARVYGSAHGVAEHATPCLIRQAPLVGLPLPNLRGGSSGAALVAPLSESDTDSIVLMAEPALGERPMQLLERIGAHLVQALNIHRDLTAAQERVAVSGARANESSAPQLVLNADRRILHANRPADALLARSRVVSERQGRLIGLTAGADRSLRQAFSALDLSRHDPSRVLTHARLLGHASDPVVTVCLRVPPLAEQDVLRPGMWVSASLHEAGARLAVDPTAIAFAFQMTPAESAVSAALAAGDSVAAIAARRNCRITTIRAHVRSILHKTGTHSQPELISALATLGGSWDGGYMSPDQCLPPRRHAA